MLLRSKRVLRLTARPHVAASALLALGAGRLVRRVEVEGDSMRPTLLAGDRLLVVRWRRAGPGDLVVLADPRARSRLLVKRVAEVGQAGLTVVGDNPAMSTDSRVFGAVGSILGRPVYRYHPPGRAGRVG